MRHWAFTLLTVFATVACASNKAHSTSDTLANLESAAPRTNRILVFTLTKGFRHDSIPQGVRCLRDLAQAQGFQIEHTEDAKQFNAKNLARFDCVVFLSTTGDVLEGEQEDDFKEWMETGGAFFGIHAATDTEFTWPWYGRMVGAYFSSHPKVQPADQLVVDAKHPATASLPARWRRTDEWYNFRGFESDIHVLLRLDEKSYVGGKNGNHPSAWCKSVGEGKMFYTAGGHTKESYAEPEFRAHLAGALAWLMDPAAKPPTIPSPASR